MPEVSVAEPDPARQQDIAMQHDTESPAGAEPLHDGSASSVRKNGDPSSVLWIVAITGFGAYLRLSTLDTRSFWLDETTSIRQALWTIPNLIARMSDNVHPPLFHMLLHVWIKLFGTLEPVVRIFPVLFGVAAIPLAFWAGRAIYDRKVGILSATFIAFAPFFVWYSQELRMYAMMLVFAFVSTGAMWLAMRDNRPRWWAVYAVATACGIMTQYFYAILIVTQAIYLFFSLMVARERELADSGSRQFVWRRPWTILRDVPQLGGWLASMAFVAIPVLWWAPLVLSHQGTYDLATTPLNYGWQAPTFGIHFNEMWMVPVETAFGFHSPDAMRNLVAMWPLLLTMVFLSIGFATRLSPRTWFLALTGIGSSIVLAAVGMWQPVLDARYFTAFLAPIVILVARFLAELKPAAFRIVVALLLAIALVGWADQSFNPQSIVKWDNRQAMSVVSQNFRNGDIVLLVPYFANSIAEYYLPPSAYAAIRGVPAFDEKGNLRNSPVQLGQDLARRVGLADRVWLIATWQETPTIAQDYNNTLDWLYRRGYRLARKWKFYRISVSLFEGKPQRGFFTPGALETSSSVSATGSVNATGSLGTTPSVSTGATANAGVRP